MRVSFNVALALLIAIPVVVALAAFFFGLQVMQPKELQSCTS